MKLIGRISMIIFAVACVYAGAQSSGGSAARAAGAQKPVPLKEAKLNIEHNATDRDTGFQGFRRQRGLAAPRCARTGWTGAQIPGARIAR